MDIKAHYSFMQYVNSDIRKNFDNQLIPSVLDLMRNNKLNLAIEQINSFYYSYQDRDRQNYLQDACNIWLEMIYEKKGDYAEALKISKALASNVQCDDSLFLARRTSIVRNLYNLKEYEQALKCANESIQQQINGDDFDLLCLLKYYVALIDVIQGKFPTKYATLIDTLIKNFSVDIEKPNFSNSQHLAKAVKQIAKLNYDANQRYSNLVVKLSNIEDKQIIAESLRKYIVEESFKFYRNLAIENLKKIEPETP